MERVQLQHGGQEGVQLQQDQDPQGGTNLQQEPGTMERVQLQHGGQERVQLQIQQGLERVQLQQSPGPTERRHHGESTTTT